MESHSLSSGSQHSPTAMSSSISDGPSSIFEGLESYAHAKYRFLKELAKKSDDAQEKFTSAAFHYVHGSELTAKIALRSAQVVDVEM